MMDPRTHAANEAAAAAGERDDGGAESNDMDKDDDTFLGAVANSNFFYASGAAEGLLVEGLELPVAFASAFAVILAQARLIARHFFVFLFLLFCPPSTRRCRDSSGQSM